MGWGLGQGYWGLVRYLGGLRLGWGHLETVKGHWRLGAPKGWAEVTGGRTRGIKAGG